MKVLVAESSTILRSRFMKLLASVPGVQSLSSASNYQQLLETWRSECPDVVVTEVFIAGGSALQALYQINKIQAQSEVIVMMDDSNESLASHCIEAGASSVLLKSSQWSDVVKQVGLLAHNAQVKSAQSVACEL